MADPGHAHDTQIQIDKQPAQAGGGALDIHWDRTHLTTSVQAVITVAVEEEGGDGYPHLHADLPEGVILRPVKHAFVHILCWCWLLVCSFRPDRVA